MTHWFDDWTPAVECTTVGAGVVMAMNLRRNLADSSGRAGYGGAMRGFRARTERGRVIEFGILEIETTKAIGIGSTHLPSQHREIEKIPTQRVISIRGGTKPLLM